MLNGSGSTSITTPQNLAADAIIPVLVKVTFNNIGNELFNEIPSTGIEINNFEITFTVNQKTSEIAVEPEEEESYSFSLKDLGTPLSVTDSIMEFHPNTLWTVLGEDLSLNSAYNLDGAFIMDSDSSDIQDFVAVHFLEESVLETTKYLIGLEVYESRLEVMVYDKNVEGVINNENVAKFINDYGDVKFTFRNVSNVSIPGE